MPMRLVVKKGSKTRSAMAASIPGPLSSTDSTAPAPFMWPWMRTEPDAPTDPVMAAAGFSVLSVPPAGKAIVSDFESLLEELARIRSRGYATLDEELELGVVGASAPVRDLSGRVIAAINVSAPKGRIGDRLESLGKYVAAAAEDLSRQLGATGVTA